MRLVPILLTSAFFAAGLPAQSGKPIATSPVLKARGPIKSHAFEVDLKGAKKLYLMVDDGGDGISCDWADWIAPRVELKDGSIVALEKPANATLGHGKLGIDRAVSGQGSMVSEGKTHPKGFGVHANAVLEFDLPAESHKFHAIGALDDGGAVRGGQPSDQSVRFSVHTTKPTASVSKPAGGSFDPENTTPRTIAVDQFSAHQDLEVTLWAQSPLFFNPTNMDVDHAGRIWVAEGVNYRRHQGRRPEGDRIVVLEDTDGDGKADSSHTFVQEKALIAPLGVAVIDNRIVVSQPPEMIVYTDVDRDLKFDPEKDTREVLLTGFGGKNHDHSLHSVTVGPDGKWYWNQGNTGAKFTDRSGQTFRIGSPYQMKDIAGQKSDDGHVYIGGFSARMNPDGTQVEIIGHNYRNSYEHIISSLGDLFQNDNDDPPACRTSYVMEYGNFGFASADGKRAWKLDKKPTEPTQIAEWRQNDPGVVPAGDVYGTGSPTGITFYENGALGKGTEGLLLSCEAARNVVFGYHPEKMGAGFKLDRFDFFTTNGGASSNNGKIKGTDSTGGTKNMDREGATLFRPSDVMVGADGAIYVADWFDPRVGGHADVDGTCSGAIYRIAPKGFEPVNPQFDLDTLAGQITALESPAINVRSLGFYRLRDRGAAAVPAVRALLDDENPYIQGRAIHLLAQLEEKGALLVESLLDSENPVHRFTAYRALRRAEGDWMLHAAKLADDEDPRVRREVALSMRDVPGGKSIPILVELAKHDLSGDRSALEAWGIGCTGKEPQVYSMLRKDKMLGGTGLEWSANEAAIAWRLGAKQGITPLVNRALADEGIEEADQVKAVDGLAFIDSPGSADGLIQVALRGKGAAQPRANWWLKNRLESRWKSDELQKKLTNAGIISGELAPLLAITLPPEPEESQLPSVEEIAKLKGDPAKGKLAAARCISCHHFAGQGAGFGPGLDGWAANQPVDVVINAIVNPSADIAHGYDGVRIETKEEGVTIDGLLLSKEDPLRIISMGGIVQAVPKAKIRKKTNLKERSLMLSADQLGMSAQDVADVVAYLKTL